MTYEEWLTHLFTREDALRNTKDGTVTIPEGKTRLDYDFAYFLVRKDMPRVHTLIIPEWVEVIESMRGDMSSDAYGYRNNPFREIIVDPRNTHYLSRDGVLFSKDGEVLICYPCGRKETEYRVPAGTKRIAECAFLRAEHLRRIYLPKSVEEVDQRAFHDYGDLSEHMQIELVREEQSE